MRKGWLLGLCILLALVSNFQLFAQVPLVLDTANTLVEDDSLAQKIKERKLAKNMANLKKSGGQSSSIKINKTKVDSLLYYAHFYMGKKYRRGGTGQAGFDCSGFTMVVFSHVGIKLPHTSAGQGLVGIQVNKTALQKGDLVLFRGTRRRSARIGHVGIVISEKGEPIRFIHSSTSQGVRVDFLDAQYYKARYLKGVRIQQLYQ